MSPNQNDKRNSAQVQLVVVHADAQGQRVDNWLVKRLKRLPRSHLYKIIRDGQVRVNGSRVRQTYRVQEGDRVRIPPVRLEPVRNHADSAAFGPFTPAILHEDECLLILDKPAGIAVHGGTGIRAGLVEWLRSTRTDSSFLELAHRLDRATSGCLVMAKSVLALRSLHSQFRTGEGIEKKYQALLHGQWKGGSRSIDLRLRVGRTSGRGLRQSVPDEQGKAALSHFRPLKRFTQHTLVEVTLATGRMHQIRAHAAAIGYPVVGDRYYGDRAADRLLRSADFQRMWLHASAITMQHPESAVSLDVRSHLPKALSKLLHVLD